MQIALRFPGRISDGERGRISKRKFSLNEINGKERLFFPLLKDNATFPAIFIKNRRELDSEVLKQEMGEMTDEFIHENHDVGAIVLECTNMCPFSRLIHDISSLPVFGIDTLMNFIYNSILPIEYMGS